MSITLEDIRQRAIASLPQPQMQRQFAPEGAYGRHRGPTAPTAHRAAVLIALAQRDGSWQFPLIVRSSSRGEHRGQISLPGGRLDQNESAWHAAVREFNEELGGGGRLVAICQLTELYVYASNHMVQPFMAVWEDAQQIVHNPDEVDEVFWVGVNELLDQQNHSVGQLARGTAVFQAQGFHLGGRFVWGATAMILGELAGMLSGDA